MKNPIIVALDLDSPQKALELATQLEPVVGGFKVGPRISHRTSPDYLQHLARLGLVFLDHKFFDIPSTTVAAVQTAAENGATWVTVHALNGPKTLQELSKLESSVRKTIPNFRVLVVTVLTSFNKDTLPSIWNPGLSISESVVSLAKQAYQAGLKSFVCSPEEIQILKKTFPDCFLVVPGIRPAGTAKGDQSRVATPQEALRSGADALVIGRPIVEAASPLNAASKMLK